MRPLVTTSGVSASRRSSAKKAASTGVSTTATGWPSSDFKLLASADTLAMGRSAEGRNAVRVAHSAGRVTTRSAPRALEPCGE